MFQTIIKRAILVGAAMLLACGAGPAAAQEQSVRPGINDSFRDPDAKVEEWVERFEGESREVFDRRNRIVAEMELKEGMAVADVGAGTGLFTRLMAQRVGKEGKVYAVDIAPKMLQYIRTSARELELPQIKTVLGEDESAKLPENAIDVVFICDTYHHFEFPEKMMKSIHRALKPKGRVVLIDFVREEGVSSDWVLGHVRAGQKVVEEEITACGFRKTREVEKVLQENYFVVFEKVDAEKEDGKEAREEAKESR